MGHEDPLLGRGLRVSFGIVSRSSNCGLTAALRLQKGALPVWAETAYCGSVRLRIAPGSVPFRAGTRPGTRHEIRRALTLSPLPKNRAEKPTARFDRSAGREYQNDLRGNNANNRPHRPDTDTHLL